MRPRIGRARSTAWITPSIAVIAISVACAASAPAAAHAAGHATLHVSATVLKRASLQLLSQPSRVVITDADIARGYVDVSDPLQLAIICNSASGYLLDFATVTDFAQNISIRGLANEVQLSPAGGLVARPASAPDVTRETLTLSFRFVLSRSVQPGIYHWPVRVFVVPA
jgi:hypothetical protein